MKALITGASSGIGRAIATELSRRGYETVLVARREGQLTELSLTLKTASYVCPCDLTDSNAAYSVFEKYPDVDLVVNCAGCGVHGAFVDTDLEREIEMINLNITCLHILTKLYLKSFVQRGYGKILNVASSAAFFSGPYFSSYYASKAYVLSLSEAVSHELENTGVTVSVFCPGPVDTDFGKRDGVSCGRGAISAESVARSAVRGLEKGKRIIFPNMQTRLLVLFSRFASRKLLLRIVGREQKRKQTKRKNNGK